MNITSDLAGFIHDIRYEQLPDDAVAQTRDAFTDTVAVIMAGVGEDVVRIVLNEHATGAGRPEARACLSPVKLPAPEAALLSGTAAHALDYDDQSLTGHPSAVLVPAILAEGEAVGATGRDMVTAYVAGYEVWAELVQRATGYHDKGWHPTSVFGVVGAAAACSVLRRLSAARATAALAIAGSHASGLAINFGTMVKPYHAGLAARNGVLSARLAASGMTAARDVFGDAHGFLTAFSPDEGADRTTPTKVGRDWYLLRHRLCVKRYPTCYFMHRSFDAATRMLASRPLRSDEIEMVEVTMGKGQTAVLKNKRPQTGLEAKFSEQFAMAAAVILGRMDIEDLRDEVVRRDDIQAFFSKVTVNAVDEYDERDPAHSPSERVVIRLTNGEMLDSGPIVSVRGHAHDPLSKDELWAKFRSCTAATHDEADARRLFHACQSVDRLESAHDLATAENVFARR